MNKEKKMFRELDDVIKQLKLVRSFEGEELVHDRRVRTALRELEKSRKGGRYNRTASCEP